MGFEPPTRELTVTPQATVCHNQELTGVEHNTTESNNFVGAREILTYIHTDSF